MPRISLLRTSLALSDEPHASTVSMLENIDRVVPRHDCFTVSSGSPGAHIIRADISQSSQWGVLRNWVCSTQAHSLRQHAWSHFLKKNHDSKQTCNFYEICWSHLKVVLEVLKDMWPESHWFEISRDWLQTTGWLRHILWLYSRSCKTSYRIELDCPNRLESGQAIRQQRCRDPNPHISVIKNVINPLTEISWLRGIWCGTSCDLVNRCPRWRILKLRSSISVN